VPIGQWLVRLIEAVLLILGRLGLVEETRPTPTPTPTELAGPTHLVVDVIDGDTVFLENGESVRYLGIDAPETHHPVRGQECYGPEATERNRQLVDGQRVRLEGDVTDKDRFGRLLRYVYVGDVFVNAELVDEGYAYSYYRPPDTKHYELLLDLELGAEEAGRGLWEACK